MKKKILALTLSVAMLTTGALTSVPAAEFEDTSICADEVSSDVNEDFDSLDTREDTEVEFDNTDSNFSSEENIDYSYEGIDSSDSEFISDETEVFTEDVGIDDDINPENSSVSETPSREPLKPAVTESIVTGLEKPLKFYPGKFYDFTVTGAGMDNTDPIENDERWEPLYWSTKNNPSTIQVNTRWRIGSSKGIMESNTYSMYIFFKKQFFDCKHGWEYTEDIQSLRITFESDSITTSELDSWINSDKDEYGNPIPTEPPTVTPTPPTVTPTPPTLQMRVNTHSITLRTGQSTSSVKVTNATPYFRVVAWYSDNTSIAKVNPYGKITAGKKPGKTYITIVMSTGEAAKIKVTVQKGKIKTKSISGLKKKVSVNKGKTLKLTPVLSPQTSQEKISYSSSNKKVATVSSKGIIKGIKAGTTKITVKSGTKKFVVTVTVPKTTTKKITGIKSAIKLKKGKTYKLKPKKVPANSDYKISYNSSNKKVATVSSKGVITARKKGSTTITIKSGKISVKCKVTVK